MHGATIKVKMNLLFPQNTLDIYKKYIICNIYYVFYILYIKISLEGSGVLF